MRMVFMRRDNGHNCLTKSYLKAKYFLNEFKTKAENIFTNHLKNQII